MAQEGDNYDDRLTRYQEFVTRHRFVPMRFRAAPL